MKRSLFLSLVFLAFSVAPASAQWTSARPDGHAPLGVMGDHTHERGEFMFSYRYMHMPMAGSRDGTEKIDDLDIVAASGAYGFTVTPTEMTMQMHMFGLMFAPLSDVTLMLMVPLVESNMDHFTRAGGTFTTESGGLGDVKLSALWTFARFGDQQAHATLGVSFPTGSIEEEDANPMSMGNEVQLPYPMQVGSGTFDLMPGVTWLGQAGMWSYGAQANAVLRLGENSRDWTLGNVYQGTVWGARMVNRNLSASLRLNARNWGDVDGQDADLAMAEADNFVPTVMTDLRGGTRVEAGLGINYYIRGGLLSGLRFAVEGLLPIYQDLDGPQLETDLVVIGGLQYAF